MIVKVLLRNSFRLVSVVTGLVVVKTSPKFGSTTADIIKTTGFTGSEVHNISRVTIKMKISNVVSFTPVACKFRGIFDVCTHSTAFSKTSTTRKSVIA